MPGVRCATQRRPAGHAARWLIDAGGLLLDEWLPTRCVLCARRDVPASVRVGRSLCADCETGLPGIGLRRCPGCALPWPAPGEASTRAHAPGTGLHAAFCPACRPRGGSPSDRTAGLVLHPALEAAASTPVPDALDAALAAIDYAAPVDRLILSMKRGVLALAAPLGALAADAAAAVFAGRPGADGADAGHAEAESIEADDPPIDVLRAWLDDLQPDAIVPMPLSAHRLAHRGFDQARLLARPVMRRLGLPLLDRALRRTRDTAQQKSLQAAGRAANLAGAFRAGDRAAGRRILLVDDVMTTGATLHEAARTLKEAGAVAVVGLVVARVR